MNSAQVSFATLALTLACGSGCLHHPLHKPPRKPAAIAETFRQQFGAAQRGSFKATSAALGTNSSALRAASRWYAQYELTLTNTQDAAARPVEFDYYLPRRRPIKGRVKTNDLDADQKIPAILILPIMGGTQYQLESYFARALTKSGFATVILHRPDIKKEVRKLEDIDDLLRRSVRILLSMALCGFLTSCAAASVTASRSNRATANEWRNAAAV